MNKQSLSSNKILVICGPTATGKTALALFLAKKFHGDLLSADSRQVYKGMDIVTGKDIPLNAKRKTLNVILSNGQTKLECWETSEGVRIWLTDLVSPKENFSVSRWVHAAEIVLKYVQKEKRFPIIVGATGFYINVLLNGIETIDIPPDEKFRNKLRNRKTKELLEMLQKIDYQRATSLNESDRKNPRRLIRAIEIAFWQTKHKVPVPKKLKADILMIGLTAPHDILCKKIDKRVEERIKQGAVGEVKRLLAKGVSWDRESMTGTGYRQLKPYFEENRALDRVVALWKIAEHHDAKKQLTRFKKDKRIKWFDISQPKWQEKVEKTVGDWYHRGDSLARDIVTRS